MSGDEDVQSHKPDVEVPRLGRVDPTNLMVVIDTNILDNMPLLQDPISVALLFYLKQHGATLGLPTIVMDEWRKHFVELCVKKVNDVARQSKWLSAHLGGRPMSRPYGNAAQTADNAFTRRIGELGDLIEVLPVKDSHWKEAGQMVLEGKPPSKPRSQQYKDSLIWRALVDAAEYQEIIFVTNDKGFFDSATGGLAGELRREVEDAELEIQITNDLKQVLEILEPDSYELAEKLSEFIADVKTEYMNQLDERLGFEYWAVNRGAGADWNLETFATEHLDELVVTITATHELMRVDDPDIDIPASTESSGSALVNIDSGDIRLSLGDVALTVYGSHGDVERVYKEESGPVPGPGAVRVRLDLGRPELWEDDF